MSGRGRRPPDGGADTVQLTDIVGPGIARPDVDELTPVRLVGRWDRVALSTPSFFVLDQPGPSTRREDEWEECVKSLNQGGFDDQKT